MIQMNNGRQTIIDGARVLFYLSLYPQCQTGVTMLPIKGDEGEQPRRLQQDCLQLSYLYVGCSNDHRIILLPVYVTLSRRCAVVQLLDE